MTTLPTPGGSIRLFRAAGINVYLHWSWLLVALIAYRRHGLYSSAAWNVAEYVSLFVIVLLHEFGHSLACRSVGGIANQIVLWPLGGVAYVQPPPRPGAFLWSIAAGPLVNVLLVPVTLLLVSLCPPLEPAPGADGVPRLPDISLFCFMLFRINLGLFIFNVLPIYPLDGGQILQSLLWFVMMRGTSIVVASALGILGGGAIAAYALVEPDEGLLAVVIGVFIALQAWSGLQYGLALRRREQLPRHRNLACPSCGAAPFQGPHWECGECGHPFDMFAERGLCPNCSTRFSGTMCPECRTMHPIAAWFTVAAGHPGPEDVIR